MASVNQDIEVFPEDLEWEVAGGLEWRQEVGDPGYKHLDAW